MNIDQYINQLEANVEQEYKSELVEVIASNTGYSYTKLNALSVKTLEVLAERLQLLIYV